MLLSLLLFLTIVSGSHAIIVLDLVKSWTWKLTSQVLFVHMSLAPAVPEAKLEVLPLTPRLDVVRQSRARESREPRESWDHDVTMIDSDWYSMILHVNCQEW